MATEEPEEGPVKTSEGAEKKERRLWPLALLLILTVLAGGGYYVLTGLTDTAHKMGSGADYDRLASKSHIYGGSAGSYRQLEVFADDSPAGAVAAGGKNSLSSLNPALTRTRDELVADATGRGGTGAAAPAGAGEEEITERAGMPAGSPEREPAMRGKLQSRGFSFPGKGGSGSRAGLPGGAAGFEGSGTLVGKGSAQRETRDGASKKGAKASVLDALKGTFKASLYGARVASQDAAKNWISRAFDAAPEAATAIEYDEKVRAKLDRVNPNSIPQFLRDQDLSADGARALADSKVSKPKLDKDATRDALDEDKDYQKKKMAQDFSNSMINGLFAGVSGTGNEGAGGSNTASVTDEDGGDGATVFADPEDEAAFNEVALDDYIATNGYGAECGCTPEAPCCCLPQNTVAQNCPMYGPFLPGDPCAAGFNTDTGVTGPISAGS